MDCNKQIKRLLKKRDYDSVYTILKGSKYEYTLDNFEKDFGKTDSEDKFCYLIYLFSKDSSAKNALLICNFLMYTDTFFYDVYPVIRMIVQHTILLSPTDNFTIELKRWILDAFWTHPDSPFSVDELKQLATDVLKENPNDKDALKIISSTPDISV